MKFRTASLAGAVAASLNVGMAHASCGSAFCVLNTIWATQGMASEPGTRGPDMRYAFVDQKQLPSGGKQIPASEDTGDTTELRSISRNQLSADRSPTVGMTMRF